MKLVRIYLSDDGQLWCYVNGDMVSLTKWCAVIDGNDSSYIFDGGMF